MAAFEMMQAMLRPFLRAPAFALTVLVLVAAVVAVNATAFSAIHALHWKALPYAQADRLVDLQANLQNFGFTVGLSEPLRRKLVDDRAHFDSAFGYMPSNQPRIDSEGRRWQIARVSQDFERVLGIAPALGRSFSVDDGETATLLLSDTAWHSHFGADPTVIGRNVQLDEATFNVIGVMPAGFVFPDRDIDAWRPLVISASERALVEKDGSVGDINVVARLAAGASVEQAQASLASIIRNTPSLQGLIKDADVNAEARLWRERFSSRHWQALSLLQLAALILLAVVSANLVNMTLDRLIGRRRELDIRRALGAGEGSILRTVLTDLTAPIIAGLMLGIALVPLGISLLERRGLLSDSLPQGSGSVAIALLAGGLVGLLLIGSTAAAIVVTQRRGGLSSRAGIAGLGRARPLLLISQVMLTTALIGGAGLLLRSALNLASADHGFDSRGVLLTFVDPVGVSMRGKPFDPAIDVPRYTPVVEAIRKDIANIPGVQHVALAQSPPFSGSEEVSTYRVPGWIEPQSARSRHVGAGYFAALGIRLSAGREFTEADLAGSGGIIVDEVYRRRYLGDVDPLSAYVDVAIDRNGNYRKLPIIGVARTVKHEALDESNEMATVYEVSRAPLPVFWLITRSSGDAAALAETVRKRIAALAPDTDLGVNKPLDDLVAASLTDRRSLLEALGGFAIATLLLAGLGLAAVLSFAIRRRTAELGVRLAIGATPPRIVGLILRQGGMLIVTGAVLGLAIGIPLARLLADRLYQIAFTDVPTWSAAFAVVVGVALLACWLPARRAARTDPMVALRGE